MFKVSVSMSEAVRDERETAQERVVENDIWCEAGERPWAYIRHRFKQIYEPLLLKHGGEHQP